MKVVERFVSINGEGQRAGQLAVFIRFAGCNLQCAYCDTKWANEKDVEVKEMTPQDIVAYIKDTGIKNVTLTGGEPLLQEEMKLLLSLLRDYEDFHVEIETNGSVDIEPFMCEQSVERDNITFTLDYKTACSGMEDKMYKNNYSNMRKVDTIKFVVGTYKDIEKAKNIIEEYKLIQKGCGIYLSPCFGSIEPAEIVDYMVKEKMNGVNVQLQLHKYIWDPAMRGV